MAKKKTKKNRQLNRRIMGVCASYYSIVSFLATLTYLLIDVFVDGFWAGMVALIISIVLFATVRIGISKISKRIENNDSRAKKLQKSLSEIAEVISCFSYPLTVGCLLLAIATSV